MRQRIENYLSIIVDGVDLTSIRGILFWIKQEDTFLEYVPIVVDNKTMLVNISKEDAMSLRDSVVEMQFAFTDSNGKSKASNIIRISVKRLLKEAGYDSV